MEPLQASGLHSPVHDNNTNENNNRTIRYPPVVHQAVARPRGRWARRLAMVAVALIGLGWLAAIPVMFHQAQRVVTNQEVAFILKSSMTSTTTTTERTGSKAENYRPDFSPSDCARLNVTSLNRPAPPFQDQDHPSETEEEVKSQNSISALLFYCAGLEEAVLEEALDLHHRTEAEFARLRSLLSQYNSSLATGGQEESSTRLRRSAAPLENSCLKTKYRSMDGSCNNLKNPHFGRASRPYERILPSAYDDLSLQRVRTLGRVSRLPNPRLVSSVVHRAKRSSSPDQKHTLALMQWGQFLAHDIAMTPKVTGPNGAKLDCSDCYAGLGNPYSPCSPIPIPGNDDHFPSKGQKDARHKCMEFTRSKPFVDDAKENEIRGSSSAIREQMNVLTAYVDSSNVYGSDLAKSRRLREGVGGRLKVLAHPMAPSGVFKPLMPQTRSNSDCVAPSGKCFFAGEERNSEQPALACIHTLFVREHNRLADQLSFENPHWDDEKLFQEARKIVVALNQHITFNEFLPRVLGPQLSKKFNIKSGDEDHHVRYDPTCSADIFNEFAAAAFRFGHTLIRPELHMMEHTIDQIAKRRANNNATVDVVHLHQHFFNPDLLMTKARAVDRLMLGVLSTPMEAFDAALAEGLTNRLFERRGESRSGMDLAALNIQRGRDHGIRGYTDYLQWSLKHCGNLGLPTTEKIDAIETFDQLALLIGLEAAHKLSRVYRHVEDIDLFTGGLSEPSLPGGVVGQTFGCIIAAQFDRLKRCDRFWWENPSEFSPQQRREIRKSTVASVMCRNWDSPGKVQPSAFDLVDSDMNPLSECMALANQIDIRAWREASKGKEERNQKSLETNDDSLQPEKKSCDVNGWIISVGEEREVGACTKCSCTPEKEECRQSSHKEDCAQVVRRHGVEAVKADPNCASKCPFQQLFSFF